jgi:pimeloyl-ACP methyl ester carboxylesterase
MFPSRVDHHISGVRLSVQTAGNGRTAVFLHGPSGALDWLPYFDALAGSYALAVPDLPGFGHSEDPDWIRTAADVALLLLDAFEERDLRDVHLIGHSFGGWVAAEMAIRDRSRLATLTLIAAAGIRVKGTPIADDFIWSPEEAARNAYVDQAYAEQQLAFVPSEDEADIIVRNRFAAARYGWQPRWYNPDLPKWLHRAKLPAHVIWGEHDQVIPPSYAAAWCTLLPDARATAIPAAGHRPFVEQAERTAAATLAFCTRYGA